MFPTFPEAEDAKEAFSEEGGSASSDSLLIFTASLGSKPLKPGKDSAVGKQRSSIQCLGSGPCICVVLSLLSLLP